MNKADDNFERQRMQNRDFSRKLKRETTDFNRDSRYASKNTNRSTPIISLFQNKSQPLSFVYLIIGAILIFTSGLFIGIKIDQKESFYSENENNSLNNISKNSLEDSTSEEEIIPKKQQKDNKAELSDGAHTDANTQKTTKSSLPAINKDLKYPPKLNQTNFFIQLGTFSREEANKWASILIKEKQDLQGRFFRTQSGKLYIGYYYSLKDAKLALKSIKKMKDGTFEEATIKNVEF